MDDFAAAVSTSRTLREVAERVPRTDFARLIEGSPALASGFALRKITLGPRRFARAVARLGLSPEQVMASIVDEFPAEFASKTEAG